MPALDVRIDGTAALAGLSASGFGTTEAPTPMSSTDSARVAGLFLAAVLAAAGATLGLTRRRVNSHELPL